MNVKWFIPLALIAGFSSNGCRDQADDAVPAATSTSETEESASQFGFPPGGGNVRRGDPREGRPDRPQRPEMEE